MNDDTKKLTVSKNIVVKFDGVSYSREDLSKAVSYWQHIISNIHDTRIIGVYLAGLSFSNLAFMLALIDSGRNYEKINDHKTILSKVDTYSKLFINGIIYAFTDILEYVPFESVDVVPTDNFTHGHNIANWGQQHSLDILFRERQEIIEYTSGSTGEPKKSIINAYIQARAIEIAIDCYFDANDYCVFLHGMGHTGVHTTAIFPAVFFASTLSLADNKSWEDEIKNATHIQYFTPMYNRFPLPKKLRVLVFGGEVLKPLMTKHVLDNCEVENFYDVYGLTECFPPLAIRKITNVDDLEMPFNWINHYHIPYVEGEILHIRRSDGVDIDTGDYAEKLEDGSYTIKGRRSQMVRLNGFLHTPLQLKIHLETHAKITNYVLTFNNHTPVLILLEQDRCLIEDYVRRFQLDVEFEFRNELNTAGGIKHVK